MRSPIQRIVHNNLTFSFLSVSHPHDLSTLPHYTSHPFPIYASGRHRLANNTAGGSYTVLKSLRVRRGNPRSPDVPLPMTALEAQKPTPMLRVAAGLLVLPRYAAALVFAEHFNTKPCRQLLLRWNNNQWDGEKRRGEK